MASKNNWYVLTGGPSSGKTTILEELEKRNFTTVKEASRHYIKGELAKGKSLEQIRSDEKKFQEAVFRQMKQFNQDLSEDVVTFFDRGYHDTAAYLKYHGHEVAEFIRKTCAEVTYKTVFVLHMLPYAPDEVRTENQQTAEELQEALIEAYQSSGHNVVEVPVLPVEERTQFILNHLESTT